MQTDRLQLRTLAPEEIRMLWHRPAAFEKHLRLGLAPGVKDLLRMEEVSAEYLAKLEQATAADPWEFGFVAIHRRDQLVMGMGGFKGPPDAAGSVEIAYGIATEYQGQGYATELARALLDYAGAHSQVRTIRAHTLPSPNASTRVLQKCGFVHLGEILDPDDGPVWRWEWRKDAAYS